jgi:hypothetical protein
MTVKNISIDSDDSDFVSIDLNVDERHLKELRPLLDQVKQLDLDEAIDRNSFGLKAQERFGNFLREMTSSDWDKLSYFLGSDSGRFNEYVGHLKDLGQHLLHETSNLINGSTTLNPVRLDVLPRILACKEYLMYFAKRFKRVPWKARCHFCYKMVATVLFSVPVLCGSVVLFGVTAMAGFLKPALEFFLLIYTFLKDDGTVPAFCREMVNVLKYSLFSLVSICDSSLTKLPTGEELDELGEIGKKLTFFASMIPQLMVHRSWTDWYKGHIPTLADIPVPPKNEFIEKIEQSKIDHKWQNGRWVCISL